MEKVVSRTSSLSDCEDWTLVDKVDVLNGTDNMSDTDSVEVLHGGEEEEEEDEDDDEEEEESEEEESEEAPKEEPKIEKPVEFVPPPVIETPIEGFSSVIPEPPATVTEEKKEIPAVEEPPIAPDTRQGRTLKQYLELGFIFLAVASFALVSSYLILAVEDGLFSVRPSPWNVLFSHGTSEQQMADALNELNGFQAEVKRLNDELAHMHKAYSLLKQNQQVIKDKLRNGDGEEPSPSSEVPEDLSGGDLLSKYMSYVNFFNDRASYRPYSPIYSRDDLTEIRKAFEDLSSPAGFEKSEIGGPLIQSIQDDLAIINELQNDPDFGYFAQKWQVKYLDFISSLKEDINLKVDKVTKHIVNNIANIHGKFLGKLCDRREKRNEVRLVNNQVLYNKFCGKAGDFIYKGDQRNENGFEGQYRKEEFRGKHYENNHHKGKYFDPDRREYDGSNKKQRNNEYNPNYKKDNNPDYQKRDFTNKKDYSSDHKKEYNPDFHKKEYSPDLKKNYGRSDYSDDSYKQKNNKYQDKKKLGQIITNSDSPETPPNPTPNVEEGKCEKVKNLESPDKGRDEESWVLKMGQGRSKSRSDSHRSDWLFDRAKARQSREESGESKWLFDRAKSREMCRDATKCSK